VRPALQHDVAVIGAAGVGAPRITDLDDRAGVIRRAGEDRAIIVLADGSKFGDVALTRWCRSTASR